jgi:hypothetical protein
MEADWAVALADRDPVIIVPWAASGDDSGECRFPRELRFIDLRSGAHLVDEIEEVKARPALRSSLLLLNGPASHLWTAKCDVWTTSTEQGDEPFDPYEMEAEAGETAFGAGSYIDLLPRDSAARGNFDAQERWIRAVTESLRAKPAKATRVDLVLRPAQVDGAPGFGVTWFVEGCGSTSHRAGQRWSEALSLALTVILDAHLLSLRREA